MRVLIALLCTQLIVPSAQSAVPTNGAPITIRAQTRDTSAQSGNPALIYLTITNVSENNRPSKP